MTSERARERIVHKYYQSWLESSVGFRRASNRDDPAELGLPRLHLDGTLLRASNDRALIAFAQLGCLRLAAKRGIVTLLSSTRQYIIAEATKTTSLDHGHDNHDEGDELWFGNASLPRKQGMSEDALAPAPYIAVGSDGTQYSAPALVVKDIAVDSRYSHHGYAGNGVSFYCGVPLVTVSGFPIGVFTITDDKPRNGLTPSELRFLQDMATVVMDHLETVQNDAARFRGERLVLGLGHFVQGESTIHRNGSLSNSDQVDSNSPDTRTLSEIVGDGATTFRGMTITNANPNSLKSHDNQSKRKSQQSEIDESTMTTLRPALHSSAKSAANIGPQGEELNETNQGSRVLMVNEDVPADATNFSQTREVEQVFSRAANILRECAAADGVVFYNAVSHNFAKGSGTSNYADAQESGEAAVISGSSDADTSTERSSDRSTRSSPGSSGLSDSGQPLHILSSRGKKSKMLGYSLDISTGSTANANIIKTLELSEQSLRRFVRRYPQGKMFYFSEDGDVSSDSDLPTTSSQRGRPAERDTDGRGKDGKLPQSSLSIATELIQVVPGARSVMWLPLWDFAKQRWSAGSFLWSRQPDRLLSGQEDLIYLRTFASCIMGEIARLEAVSSDRARTTFIANISHELRSPLHGILGSIEFLQDTSLDALQSSMTTAIETCGKTLLDTVDHVLDYAKINNLSKSDSKTKKGGRKQSQSRDQKQEDSPLEQDFNLAELTEEVIEAIYAGQIFRSAGRLDHKFTFEGRQDANLPRATRDCIQQESTAFSDAVRVVLAIKNDNNWWVNGQPGAIRRIVMNIFGNSLKYTNKGTIKISLASDVQDVKKSRRILISVADTGIGMTSEFLRNHAFAAFSQESHFSVGAGLGLNIVRQIVNSLGGKIEVFSQQGVGTEVKIWLALPEAANSIKVHSDDLLGSVAKQTAGKTICLLDPEAEVIGKQENVSESHAVVQSAFVELVKNWFGMRSIHAPSMNGVSADFFIYAEPPPIEYLLKHHGIHTSNREIPVIILATNAIESSSLLANGIHQLTDVGRVIEVMAQPCGPQKLAKILHRAMVRAARLAADPESQHTNGPADINVLDDRLGSKSYPRGSEPRSEIQPRPQYAHDDQLQAGKNHTGTANEVGERALENLRPNEKHPELPEAEDPGFIADRDEPGPTLSPQLDPYVRPTMSRRSTVGNSGPALDDLSGTSTPGPEVARILLVDDNDINLNLLAAFMKKAKLPYETAKDGQQALEAFKRGAEGSRFAHVLMDISMPVMNGIESTREIRRFEKKEGIPPANIVALTGQASQATRKEMFDAGGDEFLTKPVKFNELMKILEKPE